MDQGSTWLWHSGGHRIPRHFGSRRIPRVYCFRDDRKTSFNWIGCIRSGSNTQRRSLRQICWRFPCSPFGGYPITDFIRTTYSNRYLAGAIRTGKRFFFHPADGGCISAGLILNHLWHCQQSSPNKSAVAWVFNYIHHC